MNPILGLRDLLIVVLVPFVILLGMQRPELLPLFLPWALLFAFIAFFRGQFFRKLLSYSFPVTVGGMCYSIYLFHFAVISAFGRFTKDLPLPGDYLTHYVLQVLILASCVLTFASLFFAFVERPCMRRDWPQRAAAFLKARISRTREAS